MKTASPGICGSIIRAENGHRHRERFHMRSQAHGQDKSPAECARMCVKQGMKYALVAGNKVYALEGHESELDKLAGEKATVKGDVNGETVTVESVTPATKPSK